MAITSQQAINKRREYEKRYREENKDKIREYHKRLYKEKKEIINKRNNDYYEKTKSNTETQNRFVKNAQKYRDRHPEKHRVRAHAAWKISLKDKICEICKKNDATERHHKDYSKPLEVKLLCKPCHTKIHTKITELKCSCGKKATHIIYCCTNCFDKSSK